LTAIKLKVDIWHIHDPELLPLGLLLILLGKKVIWDAHEDYFAQFKHNNEYRKYIPLCLRGLVSSTFLNMLRLMDKHAAGVVTATDYIANTYSNSNCEIVGNEAKVEDFFLANPKFENNKVLFIGSVSDEHLFKEVVSAMQEFKNLYLVVAGNQRNTQEVNAAISILGERAILYGWANRKDLLNLISESIIGLVTYQNLPTYAKSRPTKLFEFLMSGLPVVATPIEANIRFIQESGGGVLSQGFEAKDLVNAIRLLTNSADVWHDKSQHGRDWAKQSANWEISEKRLLILYARITFSIKLTFPTSGR
jgi:glycosyltransferase involved in cell wall biosynthesis